MAGSFFLKDGITTDSQITSSGIESSIISPTHDLLTLII
jgi:hypothetical protein